MKKVTIAWVIANVEKIADPRSDISWAESPSAPRDRLPPHQYQVVLPDQKRMTDSP